MRRGPLAPRPITLPNHPPPRPQLIVNALEGSSEAISEGLLWLWVFSDVLDVAGCTLSDTLPTMVLTAWL
jgi:hypothetical protein